MGACQCKPTHIITTLYVENLKPKPIEREATQNTNFLCNSTKYLQTDSSNSIKYNNNKLSPLIKKVKTPYSMSEESYRSSGTKSHPILSKLMNKSKYRSSSSLLVCG